MPKRMLIDAAHPEETRVVVLSGNRLEEFDFESSTKKQVKGNIYLAKVTRVEPSLQAAFVEYGGNRHGFLAFSEIHPDYYRIPVADRERSEAGDANAEVEAQDAAEEEVPVPLEAALPEPVAVAPPSASDDEIGEDEIGEDEVGEAETEAEAGHGNVEAELEQETGSAIRETESVEISEDPFAPHDVPLPEIVVEPVAMALESAEDGVSNELAAAHDAADDEFSVGRAAASEDTADGESVETIGGDELLDPDAERQRFRTVRSYKIQEVIKRRQIMLVQVTKEERGNKGAALTTYLSLAGRYCVLMPNTGRGGGVSRKITNMVDRRRLKEILEELEIPDGMGVIVRTAGSERSKAEIKRDYEYLLRLWNEIRDLTLKSTAPALIYEEGNLIKRSIRDLYTRDLDEVLVEGEEGYRTAKAFMKMLMPSHAKRVQPYRDPQIGLLHRFQVESQIDAIHSPVAQLRSGGYLVINQAEALVAIDVNSGRATRERNIEETALRTNLEAADEIARQLRLRDLAGLIVIDFIDMDEHRNQVAVERRLKDALKNDRARIQVGRISPFGLLEMSRQRLRSSLVEASTQPCPHCGGTGFVRSVESAALHALRSIEEEGIRRRAAELCIYVPTAVALYILNQKRESLTQIEARYALRVTVARDDTLIPPAFRLERLRALSVSETAVPVPLTPVSVLEADEDDDDDDEPVGAAEDVDAENETSGEDERGRRRRRRRRRVRHGDEREVLPQRAEPDSDDGSEEHERMPAETTGEDGAVHGESDSDRQRRRRGRRGGRRRGRREDFAEAGSATGPVAAETIEILPVGEPSAPDDVVPEPWPVDVGLETASLAALAGSEAGPPPDEAPGSDPGVGANEAAAEAVHTDQHHTTAPAAASDEPAPAPTVETIPGIPFESPAERQLAEVAPAEAGASMAAAPAQAAAELQPSSDEQMVTDHPINPRRGWWQRLMQS